MSMFDEETREALIELFNSFPKKVTNYLVVAHSKSECETCSEAEKLARELMGLARDKLEFKIIHRDSEEARKLKPRYVPAWIFESPNYNVRYYGLPAGQEFPPFIYLQQYIATGRVKLPKNIVDEAKSIETDLNVKIFVTPECPYCPLVVDALNQVGLVNGRVLVETIEAVELPWEADKYRVFYVPAIIISDVERIDGYVPPDVLIKILKRAEYKLRGEEVPEELASIQLVPAEVSTVEHEHHHEHEHEHYVEDYEEKH